MQPLALAAAGDGAAAEPEPGTSAFAALAAADVKPDAVFFHKFYSAKEARAPARKRPAEEDASDASDAEIGALDSLLLCGLDAANALLMHAGTNWHTR